MMLLLLLLLALGRSKLSHHEADEQATCFCQEMNSQDLSMVPSFKMISSMSVRCSTIVLEIMGWRG